MKHLLLIALVSLAVGCKKESSTDYRAYLINKSGHSIEIQPYFNGSVPAANIMHIEMNDTLKIADGFFRGIYSDSSAAFVPDKFAGADSEIVIFDNTYAITHYTNTPAQLSPKHYEFSSHRNIGNPRSYQLVINNYSGTERETLFWYTFTAQDYLDAQ